MRSINKPIKILLLADYNSSHTMKWVHSLIESNIEVALFSFGKEREKYIEGSLSKLSFFSLDVPYELLQQNESSISKLQYLKAVKFIKKIINDFSPDIVHAHYASSYGFLGALTNFRPFIISVWGSDILRFPHYSFIHKNILKFSLGKSSRILATSHFLAKKTNEFTKKKIYVIPFGINLSKFNTLSVDKPFKASEIVIGTVKSLEKIYGIDTLIRSFSLIKHRNKNLPLKLLIIGRGSEERKIKSLARELIPENDYLFTDFISHDLIANYHNMIDISVFLSNQESFGVSTLEAMACCKPVVVSNTGGLSEIVDDGQNGYFVSPNNPEEAANAIEKLVGDPELRIKFGVNGREKVKTHYNWDKSVNLMLDVYKTTLETV